MRKIIRALSCALLVASSTLVVAGLNTTPAYAQYTTCAGQTCIRDGNCSNYTCTLGGTCGCSSNTCGC